MSSNTSRTDKCRSEEMKASFDCTHQRIMLLNKLLCVLSGIICEWNSFISPNGDVSYFSDLDKSPSNSLEFPQPDHAGQSLRSIKKTFDKLEKERQRLIFLKEELSKDFETVR
jgi:hypothetical protein